MKKDSSAPIRFQIICPAARQFRIEHRNQRAGLRTRVFRFSMLSALSVAAALPEDCSVEIIDENVEAVDFQSEADLIGISFMTFNAPRAYEIARRFRERGKTVFFGGYHPTLLPEEAASHCDAVCVGDAEPNLPRMIEDWRRGRLERVYRLAHAEFHGAGADRGLLRAGQYMNCAPVQATRGCRQRCEFCSVSAFSEQRFRKKPVDEVVEEIRRSNKQLVLFIDDNLSAEPAYLRQLLRAISPFRLRWFSQISFNVTGDPELLDLMCESGCRGVFIGFESLSQESLDGAGKGFNRSEAYRGGIKRLHDRNIAVMGAFVLGYDEDDPKVIQRTLCFLRDAQIDALQLTVLTPFPGTPLHRRMEESGRIFDRNWEHYDLGHVVFEPKRMSPAELRAGHDAILTKFYSWPWVLQRFRRQLRYLRPREIALLALVSWGYRRKTRRDGYVH